MSGVTAVRSDHYKSPDGEINSSKIIIQNKPPDKSLLPANEIHTNFPIIITRIRGSTYIYLSVTRGHHSFGFQSLNSKHRPRVACIGSTKPKMGGTVAMVF